MADFLIWPDRRLQTVAEPVVEIDDAVRSTWDRMVEAMDAMPGYGLAAPQLGILRRLAVVDCSTERGQAVRMANPEIIEASTELFEFEEASPNLPGVSAKVRRPRRVVVRYIAPDGTTAQRSFEDLWATSVQHQIDHLNGQLFIDRLSRTKRDMILKKWRKGRR